MSRAEYNAVRDNPQLYPPWYVGYISIICSFRGMTTSGYAKDGSRRGRCYRWEQYKNASAQRDAIADVIFACCDYRAWRNVKKCIVYCDPPYKGTTGYTRGRQATNSIDYDEYYDFCRHIGKSNIVLCSEHAMPSDFKELISVPLNIGMLKHPEKLYTLGLGGEIYGV